MKNFSVEAVVLSYRNFSEADRFLTLFTREHGKLDVLAKGVRRVPSKRAPHLEPFTLSKIYIHESSVGRLIVTQAETVASYPSIKEDIQKIGLAFYACELVSRLTRENQSHREVFERLLLFLKNLNDRGLPCTPLGPECEALDYEAIIKPFQKDILKFLGFGTEALSKHPQLRYYIEEILEGKLKTPDFLDKLK